MSHIDDLIAELCPNGVQHFELHQLFTLRNGYTPSKSEAAFWTGGTIPWFRMEDIRENGGVLADSIQHIPEIAVKGGKLFPANSMLVATSATIGEHALVTVPHLSNQRFTSLSLKPSFVDLVDMKFIYYYGFVLDHWCLNNTTTSSFSSVDMAGFKKFRIPVPPLEVQREIVRILDQFTQLQAELEAELEARRLQHGFYWESLLTPTEGWQRTTIGEVAQVFDGPHATPKKTQEGPWYLSISSLRNGRFDFAQSAHLGEGDLPRWTRRVAPRWGDTLFSYETRLGQAAFWDSDEDAALGRRMGLLRPDTAVIDPRFLTLIYLGPQFQANIRANTVTGSTVDRIPIANMASWELFIPPIHEQRRLVEILDRFDALVNDLSVGLPAELAARRKQYEYYRDRLLTFKEEAA